MAEKEAMSNTSDAPHPSADSTQELLNTVDEAIQAIAAGEMVIVVDDCDRENEGDLITLKRAIRYLVGSPTCRLYYDVQPQTSQLSGFKQ